MLAWPISAGPTTRSTRSLSCRSTDTCCTGSAPRKAACARSASYALPMLLRKMCNACIWGASKNLLPAAMKACKTCIGTCSRPALLRCPPVGYFVPVSSLRGASFGRTIAARAIRSMFFEAHYGLIAGFPAVSGADEIAARIASARQRRSPISMSGRRGWGAVMEDAHSFNDYVQRRQREDIAGRAANS